MRLECTFKDEESCYFCLEYCPMGDLTSLIQKRKKLTRSLTRFYAKELINVLEYFRKHNIVHRDLKPENILIDATFHCRVTDFGAAKIIDPKVVAEELKDKKFEFNDDDEELDQSPSFELENYDDRYGSDRALEKRNTFVGTPLYVSPEMLAHNIACFGSDLWALGCIIYQCLTGLPPFRGPSEAIVFDRILECKLDFPPDMDIEAQDFILKLMEKDPRDRLGAGDEKAPNSFKELKNHPFLKKSKFKNIYKKKPPVPSKLVRKINKEFNKPDSDIEEDDTAEDEEKVAKEAKLSSAINTFTSVDKRSHIIKNLQKMKHSDTGPKTYRGNFL